MSKETENLKLFKYDPETDDFNTTTFNVKQCLNDNWDKIDSYCEDTQKEITGIKEKDTSQDIELKQLTIQTLPHGFGKFEKNKDTGVYERIELYNPFTGSYAISSKVSNVVDGKYTKQEVTVYRHDKPGSTTYKYDLFYDEDGTLKERRLIR
ncbi:hypothetical protein EXQ37_18150 [Clostridium botulinum]|nr:hypothetical protein [Clostridium botulinum]MBO0561519.1 hypothetical protein [Clostridium botulinum]